MSSEFKLVWFDVTGVSRDGSVLVEGNVYPELFPSIIVGRYEHKGESIVCLPSQIGCRNKCKICQSAGPFFFPGEDKQKNFLRNLRAAEVVNAAMTSLERFPSSGDSKGIIFSFMGMGEPFDNTENMKLATKILGEIYPGSRFTISTIGHKLEGIRKLAREIERGEFKNIIKLHISLHAATDEKRREIIPAGSTIEKTLEVADYFARRTGTVVKFNYALIKGFNDEPKDITDLIALLSGKRETVSLIISDFNSNNSDLKVSREKADEFAEKIREHDIAVERFSSLGLDIQAGCGQLTYDRLKGSAEL